MSLNSEIDDFPERRRLLCNDWRPSTNPSSHCKQKVLDGHIDQQSNRLRKHLHARRIP